jgi:hypothetical membrane protein
MILTDQQRRGVLRARALAWAGIAATGVFFLAAMAWFPDGDEGARGGYSFGGHFLSAMGKTRAGSADNTISCLIFNGTLVMVGTILAVFWNTRAVFLTKPAQGMVLRGCGLAMGLAMAGIGLTPYDHFPHVHDRMTHLVMVFGIICFCYCLLRSHREFESWKSRLGWLAVFTTALVVWTVVKFLVSRGEIPSRPGLPLMQKLFVVLLALWVGWQGFLFGWACRREQAAVKSEPDSPATPGSAK